MARLLSNIKLTLSGSDVFVVEIRCINSCRPADSLKYNRHLYKTLLRWLKKKKRKRSNEDPQNVR